MDLLHDISTKFWSTSIWLPPNTTWSDIDPNTHSDIKYADYRHLIYPLPMAVLLLFLRLTIEK